MKPELLERACSDAGIALTLNRRRRLRPQLLLHLDFHGRSSSLARGAASLNGDFFAQALAVGTAIACGLLIGIERGFNLRRVHEGARIAGVRTFTLLGLLSGIAGLLGSLGQPFAAGGLIAGAAAMMAVGYAHRPELDKRPDATSPVAAIATLGLGFLAGVGNPALAIVGATLVTLILALKTEMHGLIGKLDDEDVKALARYAVIAGAILPFLPNGHYGPYGAWNPQKLWLVVVLVTGFSFLGYVANSDLRRAPGDDRDGRDRQGSTAPQPLPNRSPNALARSTRERRRQPVSL